MDRRLARRLVALAAAYAVALNTLLPVLTAMALPAAGGAIGLEVICSATGPGVPEKPQPPGPCCGACALPGCAATVLPEVASSGAGVSRLRALPVVLGRDARQARAPPLA
jgi:hypothetical protein